MKIENLESKIIYKDGNIIEEFGNIDKKVPINSMTKTIVAILIGIAEYKGIIKSLDDSVNYYIKDYNIDRRINIKSLLTMSSGIDCPEKKLYYSDDWIDTIARSKIIEEKIGSFEYRGASTHLLGKVISDSTDMSLEDFAIVNLFRPLGIFYDKRAEEIEYYIDDRKFKSNRAWDVDSTGNNMGSFSLRLSAKDLLKIGKLFLNNGKVDSKRIISEKFIEESYKPQVRAQNYGYYSYQAWLKKIRGYTIYSAIGIDDKYMSIVPENKSILIYISKIKKDLNYKSIQKSYIESLLKILV